MKYSIKDLKKKHIASIDKDVLEVTLEGVEGMVQIWQGFPNFETITFSSVVEGDLQTKTKGAYTNTTLYPSKEVKKASSGGFGGGMGTKLMEKKEASITKFQANKDESIKMASVMRDATMLAIAESGNAGTPDEVLLERVEKWHKYLLNKWEQPF